MDLRTSSSSGSPKLRSLLPFPILAAALASPLLCWPGAALAASSPLFGPERYERTTGAPNTYSASFDACNTAATYEIVVQNGNADGTNRLSSGTVTLNGQEIAKQSDLNQKVAEVRKTVALAAENALGVKLQSGPEGFVNVSVLCTAGCLDVVLESPSEGEQVGGQTVLARGHLLNALPGTGVTLSLRVPAGEVSLLPESRGAFFAGLVPLKQGEDQITAAATDACGFRVARTVTIHAEVPDEAPLTLRVSDRTGIVPLKVAFSAEAFLGRTVTQYSWDFDGDGAPDQEGADLAEVSFEYGAPGLFLPTVTVTDETGAQYRETAVVTALSREEIDNLLQGQWNAMKQGLMAGDTETAVKSFIGRTRGRYRTLFDALGSRRAAVASNMAQISMVYLRDLHDGGAVAKYRIRRQEPAGEMTYYIYFYKDEDGIWRIGEF